MGSKALVVFKIYPEEETELSGIEDELKTVKVGELKEIKREPLAFGLELLRVGFVIPDKEDNVMDNLEETLKKLKGVKDVKVEGFTLL